MGEGDNNNDGKIEKKELKQIIMRSIKVKPTYVKKVE